MQTSKFKKILAAATLLCASGVQAASFQFVAWDAFDTSTATLPKAADYVEPGASADLDIVGLTPQASSDFSVALKNTGTAINPNQYISLSVTVPYFTAYDFEILEFYGSATGAMNESIPSLILRSSLDGFSTDIDTILLEPIATLYTANLTALPDVGSLTGGSIEFRLYDVEVGASGATLSGIDDISVGEDMDPHFLALSGDIIAIDPGFAPAPALPALLIIGSLAAWRFRRR